MAPEQEPKKKTFVPSNPNLEFLGSYEGDLGEEYWVRWEKNPYREEKGSFIKHDEQKKVADEMKYKEVRKVEEIAVMLEHGANHGAIGHEG